MLSRRSRLQRFGSARTSDTVRSQDAPTTIGYTDKVQDMSGLQETKQERHGQQLVLMSLVCKNLNGPIQHHKGDGIVIIPTIQDSLISCMQ